MGYTVLTGIWEEIDDERDEQEKRWGVQNHEPTVWVSILAEEVGKAAQGANHLIGQGSGDRDARAQYRKRLITAAAVAKAAIESLDRNDPR